jgi:hypothetical protein
MTFRDLVVLGLLSGIAFAGNPAMPGGNTGTVRGWFVDEACTRGRVAAGRIEPSNPECAKRCVKEGSRLMFLSETDKALLEVKDPAAQVQNIGYYVELTGTTTDKKLLTVNSVKRLSEVSAFCARKPLKDKNKKDKNK